MFCRPSKDFHKLKLGWFCESRKDHHHLNETSHYPRCRHKIHRDLIRTFEHISPCRENRTTDQNLLLCRMISKSRCLGPGKACHSSLDDGSGLIFAPHIHPYSGTLKRRTYLPVVLQLLLVVSIHCRGH